jgi:replicative DNA helicase
MSPDQMLERPLPHSADAERAILGSIILSNRLADEAAVALMPEDFYIPSHRRIFLAMLELSEAGAEISPLTVAEYLRNSGEVESVGGLSFVSNLTHGLPHFNRLSTYTQIVREKSSLRRLAKLGYEIASRALEGDEDAGAVATFAEESAAEVRARAGATGGGFRSFSDVAVEAEGLYEKLARGDSEAIPTGFVELDKATRGGIQPGDLWVVAALTGKGKSAWAVGAARQQAHAGIPVAFISREMSDLENFTRAISGASGVPAWCIKPGLFPGDYERLNEWLPYVGSLPIWINSHTANIHEIRSQVKDLVRRENIRTLFVDYLQLLGVSGDSRNSTRAQEVATVSRVLKEIAMDCGIGVFALAQFNRYATHNDRPEIHHLAESSGIEKDASLVLILDMEDQQEYSSTRKCTMRIAKHRNGPLLNLDFQYDGDTLTFSAVA